ncbi:hypothetical protein QEH59_00645 [Coraliomargarita sp. SDUM461004]|uniref:Uncharacterized protein n=1 Tax=Thalassobacterium sedimentorum TaxID=3041258 RepID=A0ABU1ADX1_9BACT|nr:hypothetical protein [Coraliomargarita sp. SDUM461004]MDQ8192912.1 hypothetical protein [Coraliomargarita sp. SDUM461004]
MRHSKQLKRSYCILILLGALNTNAKTIETMATLGGYIKSDLDGKNASFISSEDTQINFIGALGKNGARQIIFGFNLPSLNGKFKSAVVEFDMRKQDATSSFPWFNIDAYGFTHKPTIDDLYIGPLDQTKVLLANDLMSNQWTQNGETIQIDVTDYLNKLYRGRTTSEENFYIRLNPDDPDGDLSTGDMREGNFARYRPLIGTKENKSSAILKILTD